jgi:hypothetical protein
MNRKVEGRDMVACFKIPSQKFPGEIEKNRGECQDGPLLAAALRYSVSSLRYYGNLGYCCCFEY